MNTSHRVQRFEPIGTSAVAQSGRTLVGLRFLAAVLYVAAELLLTSGPAAAGALEDPQSGSLEALIQGEHVAMPVLKTDMQARIQGDLATVRLVQEFVNTHDSPVHARYIFPLPENAAVFAMRMSSGDRMIEAEIRRKPEARAVFEAAKERGNQAALLSQHRPNVFTQEVSNLMPGLPIRVELEYAHVVEKVSGDYRFHFPMVVGPRYLPHGSDDMSEGAPTRQPGEPEPLPIGIWGLPASPPVAPPARVDRDRVSIQIQLEAGLPIQWVESPSHPLSVLRGGARLRTIELAGGRTLDNRDFILRYRLATHRVGAGATTSAKDGEGIVSLLIEPPVYTTDDEITAREIVFVLDCSGSMSGAPLEASKRFMRRMLPRLRPTDHFRVIRFSSAATQWSNRPMPATPDNIRAGLSYIDALHGGGGTLMTSGIRAALAPPVPENALRLVIFLTDGYIGNDIEIVRLIEQQRGEARFFSFGIGNSVNRYLLQEMARVGRGVARIVLPNEDADLAADQLADRLESPVLTDIEIDWGETAIQAVSPAEIPDLFLGQTVRVMGRYTAAGRHRVFVEGKLAGSPVRLPLDLELPIESAGPEGTALPILWARAQIEDRMIDYIAPHRGARERDALEDEVTELALEHRLLTQWTSFVAVASEIVNPRGAGAHREIAVPQVEGVAASAYPTSAIARHLPKGGHATPFQAPDAQGAGHGFSGHSAPEPGTWIALATLVTVAAWRLRQRPGQPLRTAENR